MLSETNAGNFFRTEEQNKMASCTIFKNFAIPVENVSLIILSKWIASDKFQKEVEEIRLLLKQGKIEEAQTRKQHLTAFTPSATFKEKRLPTHIDAYSGFVHLDFDKLSQEQIEQAFKIIVSIPYTFLCFISPGGKGLKVFIEVNTEAEHHEIAWQQVKDFYENATGLKADEKCKDITRLCFVSYDPQLYKNIYNEKFQVNTRELKSVELASNKRLFEKENDYAGVLEECVQFTEKKKTYTEGNRNEFIYVLASNCNRKGVPEETALQFALSNYDLPDKEIKASFRSAYTHHTNEFAKFANPANMQTEPSEDYLKNTPLIATELYEQMPEILKDGAMAISQPRERDVFLTGALSILSGCLPGIKGVYDGQEVFPNLYSFVIAPAASGKGALKFAKMLADSYHSFTVNASKNAEAQYNQEMIEHKSKHFAKRKKNEAVEPPPAKPAFKVIFIPANTSYAKILSHLDQNDGFGIICETEADTMGNVFKQDWGGYSDMLRKAFHHERISSSRKSNNEFIEVNDPRLSVALSGTPGQVAGLITSSEDGLFSRFLFYAFKVEHLWKNVSPYAQTINLTEHFRELSQEVFRMVQFLQTGETFIELTYEQWEQLNITCAAWLHDVIMFTAEEAASIVKRLGLIIYRITMAFTAMRKFESAEVAENMIANDTDFNLAVQLTEIYLHHSLLMFNNLSKQSEETHFKGGDNKRKFLAALPQEFTRQQAVTLGIQYHMKDRTVDAFLSNALKKYLSQPKTGYYKKL